MGGRTRKFTRPCLVAGDIKTYDMGKLYIITNNCANTNPIGKLYLEYDFEFFVPNSSPDPSTTPQQTSFFIQNATQTVSTGVATPVLWDSKVFDALGFGSATAGVFTPPAGCYRISTTVGCVDTTAESFDSQISLFKNGIALTLPVNAAFNANASLGATSIHNLTCEGVIPMNGTDTFQVQVTLTGAAGTLSVEAQFCQLVISLA